MGVSTAGGRNLPGDDPSSYPLRQKEGDKPFVSVTRVNITLLL